MSVLPPPAEKASYVQRMFSELAPGYDRLNRVMTFGMDAGWRKLVVETIAPLANGRAWMSARALAISCPCSRHGCRTGSPLGLISPSR